MTGVHQTAGFTKFRPRVVIRHLTAVIVVAVGDHRIAVVALRHDAIQLVAARRTHFDFPELTIEVEGDTERIAVAERPDFAVDAPIIEQAGFH